MNVFSRLIGRMCEFFRTHNFTCDVCGREVFENERICRACHAALPHNGGPVCPFCGRSVAEGGACLECKQKPLVVKKARSALLHAGEAAHLVLRFKRGDRYLFRTLAELLLPIAGEFSPDAVVGVPMTEKAERARGYNQSYLLAREYARLTALPYLEAAEKRRETQPQKSLGRAEREKNLEGCFRVTDRAAVRGKALLIVDDTMTTGSTASELASVLLRAGAVRCDLLTVTSVPQKILPRRD